MTDDSAAPDPWVRLETAVNSASRALARPSASLPMRELLARLVRDAEGVYDLSQPPDIYGGGIIADLESRLAGMLGKPAAAFFPTGTMGQQVALRCWSARTGRTKVGVHALSHPEVFEAGAFPKVSGLQTVRLSSAGRQIVAAEITASREDLGAVMFELPLRDAGYVLPSWDELVAATTAARERDAIVHFDGARLFECTPHFGRSPAEIAALADTVYVSLYKSLDSMSGAVVAGPADIVEEARVWRHRYGGRVFQQYPVALAALIGLEQELPRLGEYIDNAKAVARAIADGFDDAGLPFFRVLPEPPHIQQFQVWLPYPGRRLTEIAAELIEQTDQAVFQFPWWEPGMPPGLSTSEITASSAALEWSSDDVRAVAREFGRRILE